MFSSRAFFCSCAARALSCPPVLDHGTCHGEDLNHLNETLRKTFDSFLAFRSHFLLKTRLVGCVVLFDAPFPTPANADGAFKNGTHPTLLHYLGPAVGPFPFRFASGCEKIRFADTMAVLRYFTERQ